VRAITLHPEWAAAVVHLGKWVENRTWKPPESVIGQRVAIHAGRRVRDLPRMVQVARSVGLEVSQEGSRVVSGGVEVPIVLSSIVACVTLGGVVTDAPSGWAVPGSFHWLLDDITPIVPVPITGRLGLWEIPE